MANDEPSGIGEQTRHDLKALIEESKGRRKIPWPQVLQALAALGLLGTGASGGSYFGGATPDEACQQQVEKCNAQAFDTLRRCIEMTSTQGD